MMNPNVAAAIKRGNPVVFFDISIGDSPQGRIVMELFKDVCPKVSNTTASLNPLFLISTWFFRPLKTSGKLSHSILSVEYG